MFGPTGDPVITPIQPKIHYTREELLTLENFTAKHSALLTILEGFDYDPDDFCESMRSLPTEWNFLYVTPLDELPLTMNDPRFEGWRKWRFSIGK